MRNMKYIPQIFFKILVIEKSCKLIGEVYFPLYLQNLFQVHFPLFPQKYGFSRITKANMVHHLKLKKNTEIDGKNFFQNQP